MSETPNIAHIPTALRIAADHLQSRDPGSGAPTGAWTWLLNEASRLDRAAADDAELEEAARLAFEYAVGENWMAANKPTREMWLRAAFSFRDHYQPKSPAPDPQFIAGQITWWINTHGRTIYQAIPATIRQRTLFVDGLGAFVLDLINGDLAATSPATEKGRN